MEAIILAGGFGTRLRPLTYTRAKSLLPILNKPMIVYLLEQLPTDVDKVILAVNYKKNQIEKYFQKKKLDFDIIVNDERKPLGTGGAVKFAEHYITGRFLVLNSDIICSINLTDMIKFHIKNNSIATISLWPMDNVAEFGVADVKKDGNIVGFVEKPKPEEAPSTLINAGAYLLEPDILEYIELERLVSLEKEIFPKIIKDTGRFYGFKFEGYWMDIGRIGSYIDVHRFLMKKNNLEKVQGNNCVINGILKNSCIGNNVYVGNNSKLNSTVIYDNVRIEDNVYLNECVVGENCQISSFSRITNSVVGDNEIITKREEIDNQLVWLQPIPKDYPKKQIGNVVKK